MRPEWIASLVVVVVLLMLLCRVFFTTTLPSIGSINIDVTLSSWSCTFMLVCAPVYDLSLIHI